MIVQTPFRVDDSILQQLSSANINVEFKLPVNESTGDFFYDPWIIKDEFKGISAVEWTTDGPFDQLKLTFEKEQYKTWFLLNWEYHD